MAVGPSVLQHVPTRHYDGSHTMTTALTAKAAQWPRHVIRPAAAEAWRHLGAALAGMGDPPCRQTPAVWLSDAEADQLAAAEACRRCPAIGPCAAYALAAGETAGTWGATTPHDRGIR